MTPWTLQSFLKDMNRLTAIPISPKNKKQFQNLILEDYPFDETLLSQSSLYLYSRQMYLSLNGVHRPRVCSTMRGLSAQDLFKDVIEYSPSFSEMTWFAKSYQELADPEKELEALLRFSEIAVFHEQNHRILWRLLPPAPSKPKEAGDFCRYLNFAESLVVTLDMSLGDQLGLANSEALERLRVIYRSGGKISFISSGEEYRQYLMALWAATYFILESLHDEDILPALNYVLPGQKALNNKALKRAFELSEHFTRITNPQWQERFWKESQKKLKALQADAEEAPLYLPQDPLDLEEEFVIAKRVFAEFGL